MQEAKAIKVPNEKKLQNKIKKFLEDEGAFVIRYNAGMMINKAGIPDLIVGHHGQFIAIEVKTENGKLTKLQEYTLQKINSSKNLGVVVFGWDGFIRFWRKIIFKNK